MTYGREQMREYITEYRQKRREFAKAQLGGVCVQCGSSQNLEFDHIDPSTKTLHISKMWTASMERFLTELEKCQLLCHGCHLEKSKAEGAFTKRLRPIAHGTLWAYDGRRCRCTECREAKRLSRKKASRE